MNDTHGEKGEGWVGFDLDGTLAKYDGWKGIDHIGEPVGPMVELIKRMHDEGKVVKILTARVAPRLCGETHATGCKCGHCEEEASKPPVMQEQYLVELGKDGMTIKRRASDYIRDWCADNLGFVPDIVYQKDHLMLDLYDDRCHQVVPNTGEVVEEQRDMLAARLGAARNGLKELADANMSMRWSECLFWASFGACITMLVVAVVQAVFAATRPGRVETEAKLKAALSEYIEAKGPGFLLPREPTQEDPE